MARRRRRRQLRGLGAAGCWPGNQFLRGGLGLVAGYLAGNVVGPMVTSAGAAAPSPTSLITISPTAAPAPSTGIAATIGGLLPLIGAGLGAWIGYRKPQCKAA